MKAVLMSIQPKWCELIANGKKTVEIRKTKPKLAIPFKVYIYCTQARKPIKEDGRILLYEDDLAITNRWGRGKKIENPHGCLKKGEMLLNGKVIGEFVCDEISEHNWLSYRGDYGIDKDFLSKVCLSYKDMNGYGNEKSLYGWHISNLVIYDEPKELSEFSRHDNSYNNAFGWAFEDRAKSTPITRPPQSWCYVEVV